VVRSTQKAKIIIRLDADHQKGMGHLFRMLVLCNELLEHGMDCCFVIRSDKIAERYIAKSSIPFISVPKDLSELKIIKTTFNCIKRIKIWIYDILDTSPLWIQEIHQRSTYVVCMDDLNGGPHKADLVINPILGCREDVQQKFKTFPNVLNGPIYTILSPELDKLIPPPIQNDLEEFKVGISMGGSDTHGASVILADIIAPMKELPIKFHFFLGPQFCHHAELQNSLKNFCSDYEVHQSEPKLLTKLSCMNLIICGGGQTLFELLSIGMPLLALANESHETYTIKFFSDQKACINLGSMHTIIHTEALSSVIQSLNYSYSKLYAMGNIAKQIISSQGAAECTSKILSMLEKR